MFDIGSSVQEWASQENIKVHYSESTKSTNEDAKKILESSEEPFICVTSEQTQGKGRHSNSWSSPPEKGGLLASWVYKVEQPAQPIATPLFGWAVYKALQQEFDLPISLKAPNDIYIDDLKLAGLLLEGLSQGSTHYLIVGIGLNVFTHPKIDNSTCLIEHTNDQLEKNRWFRTLSHLNIYMAQASQACQEEQLSEVYIKDLEKALKAYPENNITKVFPDGSIELYEKDVINWRDL